jgi:putative PIN family toxin of toxin-antitoxin system
MIAVLDTIVVLQALNPRHAHAPIMDRWHAGHFVWAVSTGILMEYREVIIRQSGAARWNAFDRLLHLAAVCRGNLLHVSPSFHFRTITADQDDDKFADCAITAHADWIVTEDSHFKALIGSGFKPQPIKPGEFIARILHNKP